MNKDTSYVLVIGGTGVIGTEIVNYLCRMNYNVIYTYNNSSPTISNEKAIAFSLDVRNVSDIAKLKDFILKKSEKLESLVYNVGIVQDNLFNNVNEESLVQVMDVNFYGCFRICKAFVNDLAVSFGNIVLISSISGLIGKIGQVNYSASKAAVQSLSRTLAMEYARLGVRVNTIAPGFIDSKMVNSISSLRFKDILEKVPLRRLGDPKEVASVVEFLISDKSSYITGQTIIVDGGIVMH